MLAGGSTVPELTRVSAREEDRTAAGRGPEAIAGLGSGGVVGAVGAEGGVRAAPFEPTIGGTALRRSPCTPRSSTTR